MREFRILTVANIIAALFFYSCNELLTPLPELPANTNDLEVIHSNLIGKWADITSKGSYLIIHISDDEISIHDQYDDDVLMANYQLISTDSMKIDRQWRLEAGKSNTENEFSLSRGKDTLIIRNFLPVDYGISQFQDVKLCKID